MKKYRSFLLFLSCLLIFLCAGCGEKENLPAETDPTGSHDGQTDGTADDREPTGSDQGSHAGTEDSDLPTPPTPQEPDLSFDSMELPRDSVQTLAEQEMTPAQYTALAANGMNGALSRISTIVSPDFSLQVNGENVPVYATLAFVGVNGGGGAIQSFATVFVNNAANFRLDVTVSPLRDEIVVGNAIVLSGGVSVACTAERRSVTAAVSAPGAYTFLCNDPDQEHTLVLFVRENVDDEARIAAYRAKYGADRVKVFEAGTHEVNHISAESNSVLYLCKGAFLIAKPLKVESDVGLIEIRGKSNVTVAGYGYVEMSLLGHSERIALRAYAASKTDIREVTFINNGAWNLYMYYSENCSITSVTVLGHRMNSDGINICNSRSVQVRDCWIRTGDDCYSGKTLGGASDAYLMNVVFENCTAWAGKARCFGITGEAQKSIVGLTFRNCDILFRDATWDNSRLGGICVIVEAGSSNDVMIKDVLFENIRIHRDYGRAINVTVLDPAITGLSLTGIVFRNIVCTHAELPFRVWVANGSNQLSVTLESVIVNGTPLTADGVLTDAGASVEIKKKDD